MLDDEPEAIHRARFAACRRLPRSLALGGPRAAALRGDRLRPADHHQRQAADVGDGDRRDQRHPRALGPERVGAVGHPGVGPRDRPRWRRRSSDSANPRSSSGCRPGSVSSAPARDWARTVADLRVADRDLTRRRRGLPSSDPMTSEESQTEIEGLDGDLQARRQGEPLGAVPPPGRAGRQSFLDVGCWEGVHCAEAVRRGADSVVGVDICTCPDLTDERRPLRVRVPADGRLRRSLARASTASTWSSARG